MEEIFYQNILIGLWGKALDAGTWPLTAGTEALQVLSLKHPRGTTIAAHYHVPTHRVTEDLQKCVVVLKGVIELRLYGQDRYFFRSLSLHSGEFFVLLRGAWEVAVIEDAEFLEFKNGPFKDDRVNFSGSTV